ncbi:hypothetical protein DH2020_029971 [Rehmannia glutinosa]|uniref:RRM domain-containing protein n=1 Tax=Rehmannia glutinosa TaxID=99300 RepID=A0ABR0VM46_REHGL
MTVEICVWCWHHIIDMAEKDQSEGRCPACRTIYEKEKIVAMQANCERTMTKISSRKAKPPKAKPKANEVKKDLTNIRVIQRKMAYVIGLPLNLADEDVLLRKEYFGQYGKVTKVSLSRTAGGTIQQFINDTCSVYITYSKEEEALRCIQSVHGYVLEGRFLRASFGTAKYCHAWLKTCLATILLVYICIVLGLMKIVLGKMRLLQFIRSSTNCWRCKQCGKRSGDVLPPPVDDICNSTSTFTDKPTIRSGTSDATHGSANSTGDLTCPLSSKEKEGAIAVPHKITTFVDIVGRSNCAALEKMEMFLKMGGFQTYVLNYLQCSVIFTQKKTHSVNGFTLDHNPVHNHEDEAALPIRCVNSVLTDSCQEMKFKNSAKSDRIYRSSKSFSNEEIVEHLRRIDDGDLNNDKENSVLDAVESSIISNIMSIGLDSCEDSLTMPKGLSEFLDETDGLGGSSWSSGNSDQSGYSFVKQEGFANQMAESILPEYGNKKEQYLCKPQYPVSRPQNLAPPGFSVPSRDPPPGFSTSGRMGCLSRPRLVCIGLANASSFPSTFLQPSSTRLNSSINDVDFFDPTLLNCSKGHMGNGLSGLDNDIYGLSSRLVDKHQNYDSSFFTQMSQQTYTNGHISNINGYRHSLDEVQHKGEVGMRNERLGVEIHLLQETTDFPRKKIHNYYAASGIVPAVSAMASGSVKEVLPPVLDSSSDPPSIFDGILS